MDYQLFLLALLLIVTEVAKADRSNVDEQLPALDNGRDHDDASSVKGENRFFVESAAGMLHPHFIIAKNMDGKSRCSVMTKDECILPVDSRSRQMTLRISRLRDPQLRLFEYLYKQDEQNPDDPYELLNYPLVKNTPISVDANIEYAKVLVDQMIKESNPSNGTGTLVNLLEFSQKDCHRWTYQTFDRFSVNTKKYAIGLDETFMCLMIYQSESSNTINDTAHRNFRDEKSQIVESYRLPYPLIKSKFADSNQSAGINLEDRFKYSALTATLNCYGLEGACKDKNRYKFRLISFDEIGRISLLMYNHDESSKEGQWLEKDPDQSNLSAWTYFLNDLSLIESPNRRPARISLKSNAMLANETEMRLNLGGDLGMKDLRWQYEHAHVEAISLTPGNILCYATGLRVPADGPALKNCDYSARKMIDEADLDNSVVYAFEKYQVSEGNKSFTYRHLVYSLKHAQNDFGAVMSIGPEAWYVHCKDLNCSSKIDIFRAPYDIVSVKTEKCHKLVALYPYFYQVFEPDQSLSEAKGKVYYAKWMRFPINAALFYNTSFYLFLPVNTLIVKKITMSPKCEINFDSTSSKEYSTSEFMKSSKLNDTLIPIANVSLTGYSYYTPPDYLTDGKSQWSIDLLTKPTKLTIDSIPWISGPELSEEKLTDTRKGFRFPIWAFALPGVGLLVLIFICAAYFFFRSAGKESDGVVVMPKVEPKINSNLAAPKRGDTSPRKSSPGEISPGKSSPRKSPPRNRSPGNRKTIGSPKSKPRSAKSTKSMKTIKSPAMRNPKQTRSPKTKSSVNRVSSPRSVLN